VTLHRAENVDDPERLGRILSGLREVSRDIELVFPVHPRTRRRLSEFGLWKLIEGSGIRVVKPLGYFEFLGLLSRARWCLLIVMVFRRRLLRLVFPV